MNNRPKIHFPVSKWVHVLNSLSVLCILSSIVYLMIVYQNLPDRIPIHFNAQGEANNWGSKATIFLMPGLAILLFIPMYFLSKVPHIYNYPISITEENARRIYPVTRLFMTIINLEMVLIFTYVSFDIVGQFLGIWFIAIVFVVPLITILIFILKLMRLK